LCAEGPYRLVRHPQALARLLVVMLFGFAVQPACPAWAVGLYWGNVCLVFLGVYLEEYALRGVPAYEEYKRRITERLIPGIW